MRILISKDLKSQIVPAYPPPTRRTWPWNILANRWSLQTHQASGALTSKQTGKPTSSFMDSQTRGKTTGCPVSARWGRVLSQRRAVTQETGPVLKRGVGRHNTGMPLRPGEPGRQGRGRMWRWLQGPWDQSGQRSWWVAQAGTIWQCIQDISGFNKRSWHTSVSQLTTGTLNFCMKS